jgi:hypothetical protein
MDLSRRRPERLFGFVLAIAVQAGFLALLLISRPTFAPQEKFTKELTLFLPRLPRAAPPPISLPAPARETPPILAAPAPIVPLPPSLNTLRAAPMAPDLSGLGQSLFGCALEKWSSLTPEQRAKCVRPGEGFAVQDAPNLMGSPSRVQDNARWANALAHEQSPLWLPCTGPGYAPSGATVGVDFKCLFDRESDGTLSDPETWPTYGVKYETPEDFYKAAQASQARHSIHGGESPIAPSAHSQ